MFNSLLGVFAFVGDAIENGWNGVYGNRSDYYLCAAVQKFRDRMPPTTEPRNHLLQRALRKSYLDAVLLLCNDRLREIQPSGWRKFLSRHMKPDVADAGGLWSDKLWEKFSPTDENDRNEFLWLCAVVSTLNTERNRIDKSNKPMKVSDEIELFTQPQGTTVEQRVADIRQQLQSDLLNELRYIGSINADQLPNISADNLAEIPRRVQEMVENGWIPYQPSESLLPLDGDKRNWFKCFCGFFQQKLTGELADVFQNRLLNRLIVGEGVPQTLQLPENQTHALTFEIFQTELQKTGGAITERLNLIENKIGNVENNQTEALNKLDTLLPLIVTAENIAEVVNRLPDLIRQEGRQTRDKVEEAKEHLSDKADKILQKQEKLSEVIEVFFASQAATPERREESRRDAENFARENQLRQKHESPRNPIPNAIPNAHDVFDRRDECAKLAGLLVAEDTRLIRVVAPSGYGKTKLVAKFLQSVAANIGERNGESAADGVLFVDCKRLKAEETNRGTADIWNEILDRAGWMLGKRAEFNDEIRRIQSPSGQAAHLLDALETAGRFWLVLDNFEDLLDKESGTIGKDADDPLRHLFHGLCTDATQQRLIITTQRVPVFIGKNAPRLSDKHLLEVGGTPETDAVNYLKTEGEPYLLKQINQAVLLDFARRVDCLPLAVISLLRDLENHFADKPRGKVTVAEVESIVQSATHYVETDKASGLRLWLTEQIAKLHADEQIVLSVLSVFGKPCPQTALEFILPNVTADKIERLLARLERNKLLYQEGADFQLSAIIRNAAYSLIPDGSDDNKPANEQSDFNKKALQTQAADFYATQRKPQAEWKKIADIQPQLDEIQHRIYAEDFETAAAVLFEINLGYLFLWGNYRLLIKLCEQLQGKLPANSVQAAEQANNLGLAYHYVGRVREAIGQFETTLQIAESTNDKKVAGAALGNLGIAYESLDDHQKAIQYLQQSLEIHQLFGNRQGEGSDFDHLGNAYRNLGEYQKAIEYHEQALRISKEIGNPKSESNSFGNLGNAYRSLGKYQKAIELYEQNLEISRQIGDRQGEGTALSNLGNAYESLGKMEKACGLWKEALAIFEAIESPNANRIRSWIEAAEKPKPSSVRAIISGFILLLILGLVIFGIVSIIRWLFF